MHGLRFLGVALIVCWTINGSAAGLTTPFGINTTQVLPKGVRSLSVGGLTTTVDGWFNDIGISTGVAEPFNQQLSYGRLLKGETDEDLKLNVESQLRSKGVNLNEIAGTSYADINTRVVATIPALAYGLTEKWTVAIAVPIIYTNIDVATGFVGSPDLQTLVDDFSQKSRKQTGLIEQKLRDVIATEVANKGYKPLVDQEQTQIGDVTLVAKYLAYQSVAYSWSLTNTFSLPTAHFRDIAKVVDPTPGDGQFDYGISSTIEVPINGRWRVISNTGYVIQFADTRATRIPFSNEERLSQDVDPGASRDLGDQVFTSIAGLYNPTDLIGFGASYTLAYKERDEWRGSLATPERYHVLGVETEQFMEAIYLQTSVSTIQAYRGGRFPIPLVATLGMGQVIDGRNVRNDPLWSLNMSVFF